MLLIKVTRVGLTKVNWEHMFRGEANHIMGWQTRQTNTSNIALVIIEQNNFNVADGQFGLKTAVNNNNKYSS